MPALIHLARGGGVLTGTTALCAIRVHANTGAISVPGCRHFLLTVAPVCALCGEPRAHRVSRRITQSKGWSTHCNVLVYDNTYVLPAVKAAKLVPF